MAAEERISQLLLEYLNSFSTGSSLLPISGISLAPLLNKEFDVNMEFSLEFLGEILMLSRGPLALMARDKGILARATTKNVAKAFTSRLLVRVTKQIILDFDITKKAYKGLPKVNNKGLILKSSLTKKISKKGFKGKGS